MKKKFQKNNVKTGLPKEFFKRIGCKSSITTVIVWLPEHARILVCNSVRIISLSAIIVRKQFIRLLYFHKFRFRFGIIRLVWMPF